MFLFAYVYCYNRKKKVSDTAGRKTTRRTQAITKRYVFHANTITNKNNCNRDNSNNPKMV